MFKTEEDLVDMLDVTEPHWCRNWCLVSDFILLLQSCIEQNQKGRRKPYVSVSALNEFIEHLERKQ